MARTFVLGDIHGAHRALQQVLDRSGFNYDSDTLIQLGDITDGWTGVYACVEELLKVKHLVVLKGNHDIYFQEFLNTGIHTKNWKGGEATLLSYARLIQQDVDMQSILSGFRIPPDDVPLSHREFFTKKQQLYYIDEERRLFVHAGFKRHQPIDGQPQEKLCWDRKLWMQALSCESAARGMPAGSVKLKIHDGFTEVFIGHTPTIIWKKDTPMKAANIWNLDTGAGWNGKLTMMDVATKAFWQSDKVTELYPDEPGRMGS